VWWAGFVAGLAWTAYLWVRSPELSAPLDDEIGHVLIARDAWHDPELLLNLWGRTGNTVAYMVPAAIGLTAARLAALAMAAGTVVVATRIAQRLSSRSAAFVPLLLFFQPWFPDNGYAALTELPFMLLLTAGALAWLGERPQLASVCLGMLPLVRHEGLVPLGLWLLYLLVRRDWRPLGLALAPFLLYHALLSIVFGKVPFEIYFNASPTGRYGSGGWLYYAKPLVRSIGVVVLALALFGLIARRRERRVLLFAAPFVLYGLAEAVIYHFGWFASGGYVVFLLPLAPFAAVAAALGIDRLREAGLPWPALALVCLGAVALGLRVDPRETSEPQRVMRQAADYVRDPDRVVATHVWFFETSGARLPHADDPADPPWSQPRRPRRGDLVLWDRWYSNRFGLRKSRLTRRRGFVVVRRFGDGDAILYRRL
jgi:hypothetical protein